jgi:hypothetical protein
MSFIERERSWEYVYYTFIHVVNSPTDLRHFGSSDFIEIFRGMDRARAKTNYYILKGSEHLKK